MTEVDFILIAQSETVNYEEYSKLPLERIELYSELVFPRMVYYRNGFHSHLDIINFFRDGIFFLDADYEKRRNLLNIWNLPSTNSIHLPSYLLQYGIKSKVINNFDAEWDIFCSIYETAKIPPLVGISTTFYLSYAEICRIVKKVREKYPYSDIALGGAFVNEQAINEGTENFEKPMRKYGINYILHALNSEIDLKDLIISRKKCIDIERVHNLAYIENRDLAISPFGTTLTRWNDPILDSALILNGQLDVDFANHTLQVRTSSGCPFSCAFCSYPKTAVKYCTMKIECIERNIKSILAMPNIRNIVFIDDTFNVPITRFKEMCRMFCKYDFEWFSFLRVQFIDEETAMLMKDSGCRGVYLGVESANDVVLKNMNKKATRLQFEKGLEILCKRDIASIAAFIIGFPGETDRSIKDNIEFIENTGIDFYTLKEFYYMKHTPIYQIREKFRLTGLGNKWKHDTMDQKMAHAKKIEMFKSIKNSIFIDPDTSLWYLAYLYDQGYSFDFIAKIQKGINAVMLSQINGLYDDKDGAFKNLQEMFSEKATKQ